MRGRTRKWHVVSGRRAQPWATLFFLVVGARVNADALEYARSLGNLEGDSFEHEVCARLRTVFADFQRIPRKPSGDAGLDGLSHGHTRAYCCYGPEQEPFKTNKQGLKEDILKKFRADMRKLFELEPKGKTSVIHCASPELGTVVAQGTKLQNVYLVVSWFEDRRVIGSLTTSFKHYLAASQCNFVEPNAGVSVWGPQDLAGLAVVDEHTKFRAENNAFIAKVKAAKQAPPARPTPADFDAKFDWLCAQPNALINNIERLRAHFRQVWGTALVADQELAASSVRLHEALESARAQAAVSAELRSMQAEDPANMITNMRAEIRQHLGLAFAQTLGDVTSDVADGEIARLIGNCPIDWRK